MYLFHSLAGVEYELNPQQFQGPGAEKINGYSTGELMHCGNRKSAG
jgi:hypothetical protein